MGCYVLLVSYRDDLGFMFWYVSNFFFNGRTTHMYATRTTRQSDIDCLTRHTPTLNQATYNATLERMEIIFILLNLNKSYKCPFSLLLEKKWFAKITETACLSGWEFEVDLSLYGVYATLHFSPFWCEKETCVFQIFLLWSIQSLTCVQMVA